MHFYFISLVINAELAIIMGFLSMYVDDWLSDCGIMWIESQLRYRTGVSYFSTLYTDSLFYSYVALKSL